MLEQVIFKINSGGMIMWVLLALSFLIWSLIAKYLLLLGERGEDSLCVTIQKSLSSVHKDKVLELLEVFSERISIDEKIIMSLISIAPLLGLLGTVGGMIETFASLETMEMFKPGGGIADGISQALLTTQMGLIVAVPALMMLKWVQRKKNNLLEDLNRGLNKRMERNEV